MDASFMTRALDLAEAQLGRTAPNPAVGCIIVAAGAIVGEGATGAGGRPHAEELALEAAGAAAAGADAYVTLEPCARRSTGADPCAARLIAAQVARVHVAIGDPHPNAAGAGLAALEAAGIEVTLGLGRARAERVNAGFFLTVRAGRALVAVSERPDRFDAPFAAEPGEAAAAALARAARSGLTRLWIAPDDPRVGELERLGLLSPPHG